MDSMCIYLVFCLSLIGKVVVMRNDYSSDELYKRYPDYGKTWMFFPDGKGIPRKISLEEKDLPPEPRLDPSLYVSFNLYTRKNKNESYILTPDKRKSLLESPFDKSKDTKFVIHGWMSSGQSDTCQSIKNAYLDKKDVNVIVVDWSELSSTFFYILPVLRTRGVGKYYAQLLDFLVEEGANPKSFHLIGHSLGAHVSGFAGSFTKTKPGRITGLDPALPGFTYIASDDDRLDKSDADFVDAIHTCAGALGYFGQIGDVDFYPNGGTPAQPGCFGLQEIIEACSHGRSWKYFAESITSENGFYGIQCDSWHNFEIGKCKKNLFKMGDQLPKDAPHGSYYLKTRDESPFALGEHMTIPFDGNNEIQNDSTT